MECIISKLTQLKEKEHSFLNERESEHERQHFERIRCKDYRGSDPSLSQIRHEPFKAAQCHTERKELEYTRRPRLTISEDLGPHLATGRG